MMIEFLRERIDLFKQGGHEVVSIRVPTQMYNDLMQEIGQTNENVELDGVVISEDNTVPAPRYQMKGSE